MPMSTTKSTSLLSLFLASFLIAACHKPAETTSAAANEDCSFRTGNLDKLHCKVSIYRLASDPQAYVGKDVYTFGFLRVEEGKAVALAPTPYTFDSNDTIGCVAIRSVKAIRIAQQSGMNADGVYAVSLGGLLLRPKDDICVASLSEVVVTSAKETGIK